MLKGHCGESGVCERVSRNAGSAADSQKDREGDLTSIQKYQLCTGIMPYFVEANCRLFQPVQICDSRYPRRKSTINRQSTNQGTACQTRIFESATVSRVPHEFLRVGPLIVSEPVCTTLQCALGPGQAYRVRTNALEVWSRGTYIVVSYSPRTLQNSCMFRFLASGCMFLSNASHRRGKRTASWFDVDPNLMLNHPMKS